MYEVNRVNNAIIAKKEYSKPFLNINRVNLLIVAMGNIIFNG